MPKEKLTTAAADAVPVMPVAIRQPGSRRISFAPLFRGGGVIGKDLVRYAPVALLIPAATAFIMLVVLMFTPAGRRTEMHTNLVGAIPVIYSAIALITAYAIGLVLSADEEETHTRRLLDMLPGGGISYFASKVVVSFVLFFVAAATGALLLGAVLHTSPWQVIGTTLAKMASQGTAPGQVAASAGIVALFAISTGLGMGMLLKSIAGAAVSGMICAIVLSLLAHDSGWNTFVAVMFSWSLFMLTIGAIRFMRPEQESRRSISDAAVESVFESIRGGEPGTKVRFLPPHVHVLRTTGTLMLALVLIAAAFMLRKGMPEASPIMFAVSVLGLFLGAVAFLPAELDSQRFFVHALPVSRERLFWPRVGSLVFWIFLIWAVGMLGVFLATVFSDTAVRQIADVPKAVLYGVPLFALSIGFMGAFLGMLFRMFHRSILIASVLAALVGGVWLGALGSAINTSPSLADLVWIGAVFVLFPLLAAWFVFCRTPLLAQADNRRGAISVLLLAGMMIWGVFLIGFSPSDMLMILFGIRG